MTNEVDKKALQHKLKRSAALLRLAIFCIPAFALLLLALKWLTPAGWEVNINLDPLPKYTHLIEHAPFAGNVFIFSNIITLLLLGSFLFYLQRLMGLFQKGEYFTKSNLQCYTFIILLQGGLISKEILQNIYVYYLQLTYTPEVRPLIDLSLSLLFYLLVLQVIIRLLRIAHLHESENKEFV